MKSVTSLKGGEIFAIPLFVSDILDTKSFSREKFEDRGAEFAFCRVISNMQGSGIFIEVFDLVGELEMDLESIINSQRLFRPICISGLGIGKKRWKKLFVQEPYDKESDSNYSKIQLVLGFANHLRLWQNGVEQPISVQDAETYES